MSLPSLTFYRLSDTTPANTLVSDLLDAIFAALTQATDFHGATLPSTHVWSWAKYTNTVTEAVYSTAPPSGTSMTRTPSIIYGAQAVATKTPVMNVDTYTAANVHLGMNLRGGSFNAWDNTNPFTSGQFSGYVRTTSTGANLTTTKVRAFVSQETIVLNIIQGATNVISFINMAGAIIEPWGSDTTIDAETDGRVYGTIASGAAAPANSWASSSGTNDWFHHGGSNGNAHCFMFNPGTALTGSSSQLAVESELFWRRANTTTQKATLFGSNICRPLYMGRAAAGAAVGRLREVFLPGAVRGGFTLANAGVDKQHAIGYDISTADDAFTLKSA